MNKKGYDNYWQEREAYIQSVEDVYISEQERRLIAAYENTKDRLLKEIDSFYNKYATDNKIELADAKKYLQGYDLQQFKKLAAKHKKTLSKLTDKEDIKKELKRLDNLIQRARVQIQEEIIEKINFELNKVAIQESRILNNTLEEIYKDRWNIDGYEISKLMDTNFTALGEKQLQEAIRTKWAGRNFSDSIWANKEKLLAGLEKILTQDFVRGRGSRVVGKDFAKKMNTSIYQATRIIRTESAYIGNKAILDNYKIRGVDEYVYSATLDNRTSEICGELDGKTFAVKDAEIGLNYPPLHPHCRSTTITKFAQEFITDRIGKDAKGKYSMFAGDINYKEWVKQVNPTKKQKEIVKKMPKG